MWVTNTLGIMLEILSNYPGSKFSVRIIRGIKRQFFHMVTHVFDNSNLSQEIFAISTWRAVICSLGHGRKHMLMILSTIWRPGFMVINYNIMAFFQESFLFGGGGWICCYAIFHPYANFSTIFGPNFRGQTPWGGDPSLPCGRKPKNNDHHRSLTN